MTKLSYEDAMRKCETLGVELISPESEWKGNKYKVNGKVILNKYLFRGSKGHEFYRSYEGVVNNKQVNCEKCAKEIVKLAHFINYEEACCRIRNLNCEPLFSKDEWKGVKRKNGDKYETFKYKFKDPNGHEFFRSYDSLINAKSIYCEECSKQIVKEKNFIPYDEACNRIIKVNCIPMFSKEEWNGTHEDYWFKDKFGHKFYRRYTDVARGRSVLCDECVAKLKIENSKISKEEYVERNELILQRQGLEVLTLYNDFKGLNKKVKVKCNFCSKVKDVIYVNIWSRKDCCSDCGKRISYGEAKFIALSKSNGLLFEQQAKFDDLKYKDYLRVDFLSRSAKIAVEIQSSLHTIFNEYIHKNYNNFIEYQKRDEMKRKYLVDHGYEVTYIDADEYRFEENLERLIKYLKNNKKIERIEETPIKWIDVIKECMHGKPVVSFYGDTGKIKSKYNNVQIASEIEGIKASSIYDVINNKMNHAKGLIFKYDDGNTYEEVQPIENLIVSNTSGIQIVNKKTKEKFKFKTLKEGSIYLEVDNRIISRYLTGKGKLPKRISEYWEIYRGDRIE